MLNLFFFMMARCLTFCLINYQKKQKEELNKISKQKHKTSRSLVKRFSEILVSTTILTNLALTKQVFVILKNITVEDLTREYSPTDVKELCLRTKVRVDMTRFNCVYDAKRRLERKGRRISNALLVKAVGRIVEPYTEKEISDGNHILQCELKKENNFRLDRWKFVASRSLLGRSSTPVLENLPQAHDSDVTSQKRQGEQSEDVELIPFSSSPEMRSSSFKSFVNDIEMANEKNIVAAEMSDGLEWIDEALEGLDHEIASFDEFFSKPEIQGNTSSGVFSCVSDLLKDDETLNDEAITDWFLGARKQLENIELFL